jgi:hypothetical protein
MHVVQILLPLSDNRGQPFSASLLGEVREELISRFGGLTAYTRAPAEGVWAHGGGRQRDNIAVVEVMVQSLDAGWWRDFRQRLERLLDQEALVIRAFEITTF